ncbi:MAG: hemolysin family protein [Dysgonamonadaceae bacterium]|nr:hemolysin family protein [Dysgonamonadaceae bacterium]MDD3355723.1 hemolysin family protein [Dysgonamonadaceae bacterium]MDD3727458.1 hemolysin family protein [Dysgonamonadaceae bacterium]MDD4246122.1 hemolysin family protein [Dysgonamonadaceae bacterium]MDD4605373.1 hemolysin family protein [Dysgonamonadaceae bacterium]
MNSSIVMTLWIASLVLSVFFSGMEIAFISSDKLRYAMSKKNKSALDYILNVLYSHPRKFLTTLTIGNLMVLIVFVFCTIQLSNTYIFLNITESTTVALFLQFLAATVIILITGELLPRAIFKSNANLWVKVLSIPAFLFYVLLFPVAKTFTSIGRFILRLTGVKFNPAEERALGRIELDSYVKQGIGETPDVNIVDSEVKIFRNALDFSSIKLRDCMVPRTDIIATSKETPIEELKDIFVESGFSKILVYEDDIDNIIGYIHMWEMFSNPADWTREIASISFYPDSMLARNLMSELLQQRKSIAVVVDEFGGTAGIITTEDLVEEIFGDIEDEYDVKTYVAKKISDNEYILSGRLEITQLNEMFDLHLPQEDDYTTVAGLILHHIQRFPKTYETIEIDRFTFKILKVTARKIEVIKLIVNEN